MTVKMTAWDLRWDELPRMGERLLRDHFWHELQDIAAPLYKMIIRRLDQVLCLVYTHRHNPDADLLPLDRLRNGVEGRDEAGINKIFNFRKLGKFQ